MSDLLVGVDLDDVLLDLNAALRSYHNARFNTAYERDDHVAYELEKVWGCTRAEALDRVADMYVSDEHRDAIPVPGAQDAVRELASFSRLVIVTGKPDYLRTHTIEWLNRYFPNSFESVEFTNAFTDGEHPRRTKREVCDSLGVDCFVDDHLDFVREIATPDRQVLLFDAPWNQGVTPEGVTRVFSWDEVVPLVRSLS